MKPTLHVAPGLRVHLWTVTETSEVRKVGQGIPKRYWLCRCDCGTERFVLEESLRQQVSTNCGCVRRAKVGARNHTHGLTNTREYVVWCGMIARCENPKHKGYHTYGGKGVRVCDRWRNSFETFLSDMGMPPSPKHQIDRIDPTGNYEPSNCRWVTNRQNSRNTRKTIKVEYGGETLALNDWANRIGIPEKTLYARIKVYGWPVHEAFTTPVLSFSECAKRSRKSRPVAG